MNFCCLCFCAAMWKAACHLHCWAPPTPMQDARPHFRCQASSISPTNSCQVTFSDLQVKLDRRKEKEVIWSVSRAKAVSVSSLAPWGGQEARGIAAHGSHLSPMPASICLLLAVAVPLTAAHVPLQVSLPVPCPAPAQPLQEGQQRDGGWSCFLAEMYIF